jgi:endonuclease/exonuclease/phosphatase family metal-dependent hydrolase
VNQVKLKVVTYNICHGLGIDSKQDLMRTIEVIQQSGADLVGLQEVDCHYGERSGWQDQPAQLAEALGMYVAYGPNLDLDPIPANPGSRRQYGTAILSRYPISYTHNHPLPQVIVSGAWYEARGLLEAYVQINGRTLRFINTHLGLMQEERSVQVNVLLELLKTHKAGHLGTIITGDFNAEPDSPELGPLHNVVRDTYAESHKGAHTNTFMVRSDNGAIQAVRCIDYIYCSPEIRVTGAAVLQTYASDHLPLDATLEIFV